MKNKMEKEGYILGKISFLHRRNSFSMLTIDEKMEVKIKERKRMQQDFVDNTSYRKQSEEIDKATKKGSHFFLSFLFTILFLVSIGYVFYAIFYGNNQINQTEIIIESILLFLLSTSIIIGYKRKGKETGKAFGTTSTILMTLFLAFCLTTKLGIIKLPTNSVMKDFTDVSIQKALTWADANHITVEQVYDDSDTVEEYNIIKQNVYPNVLASSIKTVEFTVSSGPDYNKETVIPDMTGWNIDEAVKLIDENFLNNITIDFEKNDEIEKDIIIEQSRKGNMKRNDEIHFKVSFGSEDISGDITIDDLSNLSEFKAVLWLKRNNIPYEIIREFSNKVKKGYVIRQEPKKGTKVNHDNKITLVLSRGRKITVPDLQKMNQKQITKWIIENHLKIEFNDRYDSNIKKGKVIEASHKKGNEIEEGTTIQITISKGALKFPKFSSLEDFRSWANRYGIAFTEEYEQNKDIKQGDIIRFSVKEGDNINPNENIIITISSGDKIMIPNFIGKKKSDIESTCKSLSINCTFYYAGNSSQERDIALSQNKKAGSEVVKDTYVNIGLSSGKRTSNPNINNSTSKPSQGGNNNTSSPTPTPKPVCNTKTFYIQPTWIIINDHEATCRNIKENNPGYSFTCNFRASDSGKKGQVLNANQLNGTTINSCNTVTLDIKNN